jgi:hypothetical protein
MAGYAYAHRFVDYSRTNVNMTTAILRFVYDVRGNRRSNPVTLRQIQTYFRATAAEFTAAVVDKLLADGRLVILRTGARKRCGYVYEITPCSVACLMVLPYGRRAIGDQKLQKGRHWKRFKLLRRIERQNRVVNSSIPQFTHQY